MYIIENISFIDTYPSIIQYIIEIILFNPYQYNKWLELKYHTNIDLLVVTEVMNTSSIFQL